MIAVPGPPNVISQNTSLAIELLTRYENKWKIQTNINKFQTLNIARRKTLPIITDEQAIPYTNKATVLGLTFSTSSITPQITTRRGIAMKTLKRLQRFRNLSTNNKRTLYKITRRPQLLYPINPLNTISHVSCRKLQQVQNRSPKIYKENTRLTDRIPSTTLHTRNDLSAKNTYIHRRAIDAWTKLHDKNPNLYTTPWSRKHTNFPTSFLNELGSPRTPTNLRLTNNSLTNDELLIGPPSLELRTRSD